MTHVCQARTKRAARSAAFLIAFAILLLGSAASAYAAGSAAFSQVVPAAGSSVGTKPTQIILVADDTKPVISATIKVNGVNARTWTTNPVGHWQYDDDAECDVFIVDDPTVVMMGSYKDSWTMLSGTNTVVATVVSGAGISTYTWTFDYVTGTTVGTVAPASAAELPASPGVVSASLTSPFTTFTSVMKLDGAVVPTTYSAATKTFTHTPGAALAPGSHTVVFTATAAAGSATKTWSFKVTPPMSSTFDCKGCHLTYPASHTKDVCAKCHTTPWTPAGQHGSAIPTVAGCMGPSANGACHTFEHSGYMGVGTAGLACTDCHNATYPSVARHTDVLTTAAHGGATPSTFCDSCHATALVAEHAKYPSAAAIKYQCTICHGSGARQQAKDAVSARNKTCGGCHSAPHAAQHANVSATCGGASECHTKTDLTSVHARIGCEGCHSSTATAVVAAIAGHKRDCASCHNPMAVHGDVHNASTTYSGDVQGVNLFCTSCHRVNLLADHGTDYNNCPMCHASGGPRSSFTTWDKTCRTGACHPMANPLDTRAPHPAPTRRMDHTVVANGEMPAGYCQSCHGNPERWQCGAPFGCHAGTTPPFTSVDYKPPTTTPTRSGEDPIIWKLSATDIGDGVTATYYSFDSAPFTLYTAADAASGIVNPADGVEPWSHTLRYYSTDAAGNTEATQTSIYNVTDITAPVVSFPGALWLGGDSYVAKSLTMSVVDPKVRGLNTGVALIHTEVLTYYRIYTYPYPTPFYQQMAEFSYPLDASWDSTRDISSFQNYAIAKDSPGSWPTWSSPGSTDGGFTMQYYARDYTGNQTPMLHANISIDNAGPTTTTSVITAGVRWKLSSSDIAGVAGTYYSFDNAPFATYGPSEDSAGITNTQPGGNDLGDHTLRYYSVDGLGNIETTKTYTYAIAETTPPQASISATMTSSTIFINAWDPTGAQPASGIKSITGSVVRMSPYGIVRSINTTFAAGACMSTSLSLGVLPSDGQYYVIYTIKDWAGNTSQWYGEQYFRVDTSAPTTYVTWMGLGNWQVYGDDTYYGIGTAATYYSLDGGPYQVLSGTMVYSTPDMLATWGTHTVSAYSVDKYGFTEAIPKTGSYTVQDTTKPTASVVASGYSSAYVSAQDTGAVQSGIKEIHYRVNSGSWVVVPFASGSPTAAVKADLNLTEGFKTVEYYSVDYAGNTMATLSYQLWIDLGPPVVSITRLTTNPNGSVVVRVSAVDTGRGVNWVNIERTEPVSGYVSSTYYGGPGPFDLTFQPPAWGDATATVTAYAADQINQQSEKLTVKVPVNGPADLLPPTTTSSIETGALLGSPDGSIPILVAATDALSGVDWLMYRIDGGDWQTIPASGRYVYVTGYGAHTFSCYSTDRAGNVEAQKDITFDIVHYAGLRFDMKNTLYPNADWKDHNYAYDVEVLDSLGNYYEDMSSTTQDPNGAVMLFGAMTFPEQPWTVKLTLHAESVDQVYTWSDVSVGVNQMVDLNGTYTDSLSSFDFIAPFTGSDLQTDYSVATGQSVLITLDPSDTGGSGVASTQYILDGEPAVAGTVVTVPDSGPGPILHTIEFWSTDGVGNQESHNIVNFTTTPVL